MISNSKAGLAFRSEIRPRLRFLAPVALRLSLFWWARGSGKEVRGHHEGRKIYNNNAKRWEDWRTSKKRNEILVSDSVKPYFYENTD
jgi:hypothetical protein